VIFLLRTLSTSYVRRHPGKALLATLGIAMGVATFVSIKAAQRTLVGGLGTTIDRLAGRAQLQITSIGGVSETLRDTLRDVPEVDAEEPVIEQVVQPEPPSLGSLLIVGVDLVGDHEIRDYLFEGDDADVDDPLVFLAQPDSIALSRDFAARAGIGKGDSLTVHVGGSMKTFTVRALLELKGFARAYGGNIAITDVYAAEDTFGRGRRFDRIDIRLRESASIDSGLSAIERAIGSGYRIDTPARRGAQVERIAAGFVGAFNVTSVLALGIGLYLIFNVFTIGVQRRRRDIGILRAIGADPWQVCMLFLCEAAVLGAIGGLLGVVIGARVADRTFSVLGAALEVMHGVSDAAAPALSWRLIAEGIAIGIGASLVGAWVPSREAARVHPTDAIATGLFTARPPRPSLWRSLSGVVLLLAAFVVARLGLIRGPLLLPVVAGLGAVGTTVLAGRVARALISPVRPLMSCLAPAAGRVAADSLVGHPRRTAGTAAVLTVNMAFVLGTAGYLQAVRSAFDRWVGDVITADLFVRASAGLGPSAVRLPAEIGAELARVRGVASVEGFRNERVPFRGEEVALVAIDAAGFAEHTRHEFLSGDDRAFLTKLPRDGEAVASENFARRFGLTAGDVITLDSPTGAVALPIAAVVVDFISDRGTIMVDRSLFTARWGNDRVDTFHVSLASGADPSTVRTAMRSALGNDVPALISTRAEFVAEVNRALELFSILIRATVVITLVVAFMGVATSLLVSVAERSRDIGVLKALGAKHVQIGGAVAWEAVTLAIVSLLLAVPLGELLAWFLRARISENVAGFHFPREFPVAVLQQTLIILPLISLVATWMPTRWASSLPITEAISYE
jgi:putative ABC transport system permease protein